MLDKLATLADKFDSQVRGSMHYTQIRIFSDGTGCISVVNTSTNPEDEPMYRSFQSLEEGIEVLQRCEMTAADHIAALVEMNDDPELDAALWAHVKRVVGDADLTNPRVIRDVYPGAFRGRVTAAGIH